jgi:hypothetical protein
MIGNERCRAWAAWVCVLLIERIPKCKGGGSLYLLVFLRYVFLDYCCGDGSSGWRCYETQERHR